MEQVQNKKEETVKVLAIPYTPQKLRLVADLVRGKKIDRAMSILKVLNKKGAKYILKAIESAIANMNYKLGYKPENLYIKTVMVDEESTKYSRKGMFVSRARYTLLKRRKSKLTLVIAEK